MNSLKNIRRASNPLYPLPADYSQLTADGQRQARVAACSLHASPLERVQAWSFFREYYLVNAPPGMFYETDETGRSNFCTSAAFHYQGVYDSYRYMRNLEAAPRGFGKSKIWTGELPLLDLLTLASPSIGIIVSTDDLRTQKFALIRRQLTDNPRIVDDFGNMQPAKGRGVWSLRYMTLRNGAILAGYTVEGRKRGGRHIKIYVDDAEYDPKASTPPTRMREGLETLLTKVLIPMLPPRASIFWICTVISRRSFAWHVWDGGDPRYKRWNKRLFKANEGGVTGLDDPNCKLLWPELWTREVLLERRESMGWVAYAAEYLNEPISEADSILRPEPKHFYRVEANADYRKAPFHTDATVAYTDDSLQKTSIPLHNILTAHFRVMAVDYAPTRNRLSDFSCVEVIGVDHLNAIWLWDMWLGKVRDADLLRVIYEMGKRWLVQVVGVEAVSLQYQLFESVRTYVADRSLEGWTPHIYPIRRPTNMSKADWMAGLEWRFTSEKPRVYLPGHLRDVPPFIDFMYQTENFTYDLALLDHDDALDTFSMVHNVIHDQGRPIEKEEPLDSVAQVVRAIREGRLIDEYGMPLGARVPANILFHPEVRMALEESRHREYTKEVLKRQGVGRLGAVPVIGRAVRRSY